MSHENQHPAVNEQSREPRRPVFDLEQIPPGETARLLTALGMARDNYDRTHYYRGAPNPDNFYWSLIDRVIIDLQDIARSSDKAMDIYMTLTNYPSRQAQLGAVDMAAELLRRNLDDPEARQQVIDPWINLMHHAYDSDVQTAAEHAMWEVVYHTDWPDEPTRRYLESRMPEDE